MTNKDTITLPREVVEKAVKAFENGCPPTCENGMIDSGGFHPWGEPMLDLCPACLAFEHLRTHLAAEQPKPKPVAWQCREHGDDEWFDCSKEAYGINPSRYVYRCLYAAPPDTEALRRDAERYRWLRDNAAGFSGKTLDAAIDAAMGDKT